MMRAIAIKELRETAGIAVIGLLLYGAIIGTLLLAAVSVSGNNQHPVPFVSDGFMGNFQVISIGLAIAIGFRQSAWEGMRGTYLFLLHRPAPHQKIFVQKIIIGLLLLELTAAVPLLAYGVWADLPGTHPTPFEWNMTIGSWCVWICLPVVYLGAFLAGIRPGLWRGTRLMPLFAGMGMLVVSSDLTWWGAVASSVVVSAVLLSGVHYVAAERDFG